MTKTTTWTVAGASVCTLTFTVADDHTDGDHGDLDSITRTVDGRVEGGDFTFEDADILEDAFAFRSRAEFAATLAARIVCNRQSWLPCPDLRGQS